MSESDYEILHALAGTPGNRIRALDLRQRIGWEKSRLSHHIARMERRSLLERVICEQDSRGFDVVLTDAGRRAITEACGEHGRMVRAYLLSALTPTQLDALTEISEAVIARLAAQGFEPGERST